MMNNPFIELDRYARHDEAPDEHTAGIVAIIERLPEGTYAVCQCGMYTAAATSAGRLILYRHLEDQPHICESLSVYYDDRRPGA
jgi:hypothetical protein